MSRSPLPAWRKLFAIGGAPAASHVVLSRAPLSDRLLQPLAGARVVNVDRLEALTKPLDIGGVLWRVTAGTADARKTDVPDLRVLDARAERVSDVVRDVSTAREPLVAPAPPNRARFDAMSSGNISNQAQPQAARSSVNSAAQTARAQRMVSATPSTVRGKPIARFATAPRDNSTWRPFSTADFGSAVRSSQAIISSANGRGANSRVIVTSAVADIDRLLAIGSPVASVTSTGSNANRAARPGAGVPDSNVRGVSSLLADVVDRVRSATMASAATTPDESRAVARKTFAATSEPSRDIDHPPATTDAVGGFRGLAQRTLVSTRSAPRASAQHIETEKHVSNDLTLDSLDSRVADSLARVLEREARRHGIDLAEARV